MTVRATVVKTIRPDTVFVPYHWPLERAANNMTVRAIERTSDAAPTIVGKSNP